MHTTRFFAAITRLNRRRCAKLQEQLVLFKPRARAARDAAALCTLHNKRGTVVAANRCEVAKPCGNCSSLCRSHAAERARPSMYLSRVAVSTEAVEDQGCCTQRITSSFAVSDDAAIVHALAQARVESCSKPT